MADRLTALQTDLASRYVIERVLGHGGMATVYLAHDVRHGRPVALKVLHADLAHAAGAERFQREIRLAARLQHPHILTVHDSGESSGQLWFTMPYVAGESLRDRLRRDRQLPVADAVRIARECAEALGHAHDQGIVHRDIKPENILLSGGHALVADFGIARALAPTEERLTATGTSVGTPAYMSPEQAAGGERVDGRTDIYSLGAVLYEMLVGEPPFTGPTAQAVIAKRFHGEVPRVRPARPSVGEGLELAVRRALAPVPADRFATAADFGRALDVATIPSDLPARTIGLGRSGMRRVLAATAVIALAVLAAFVLRPEPEHTASRAVTRVAVLPFENLGDSAEAYFADGIANEIRGKLSQLAGLSVVARTSSNEYRKSAKSARQIARELGADYLLTATVQWRREPGKPSAVRVIPELVDVSTDRAPTTRWQEPFDAALTDVFRVQTDIASQVATRLDVALGGDDRGLLSRRPTANVAAYDAYLRAENLAGGVSLFEPNVLRRSIALYRESVTLDSGFVEAWSQMSRAHALLYYNTAPLPTDAEAARTAAERARALAPERPEPHWALGDYYGYVLRDYHRALAEYQAALRIAPRHAELLVSTAVAEQAAGEWNEALAALDRAQSLDPRSVSTAWKRGQTLLYLRRDDEALQAIDRGLSVAPASLTLIQQKAMVYLARGDLPGARAVLATVPPAVSPAALVAFMASYWDLFWVLDGAQQSMLLGLTPAEFEGNRAAWAMNLAQTWALRGDRRRSMTYADSARLEFVQQLRAAPGDPQLHVLHGLSLAYLGRKASAIEEGRRATTLLPITRNAYLGPYYQHQLARILVLSGEVERALDQLEPLLNVPYYLTPDWLEIDPTLAPLRGNPRFERLVGVRPGGSQAADSPNRR